MAGAAARDAGADEMAAFIAEARAGGRLLSEVPLDAIDAHHLHRDRLSADPDDPATGEEMRLLIDSIRARGLQVPLDVMERPGGGLALVSGLRRLSALRHLHAETGASRFATARVRVVAPADMGDAYRAMVEENELRAGVSFYERARVVVKAVESGAFPDVPEGLRALYGGVPRARRSKVGAFVPVVEALDGVLSHPAALTEKRGLALGAALQGPGAAALAERLRGALERADAPEAEQAAIDAVLEGAAVAPPTAAAPARRPRKAPPPEALPEAPQEMPKRIEIPTRMVTVTRDAAQHLTLRGTGVDDALEAELRAWLNARDQAFLTMKR